MKRQTYLNIRKTIFLYASVAAMALALPACVKGFKVEVKDGMIGSTSQIVTTQTPDDRPYTAPQFELNLTSESSQAIINFILENDPTAQNIMGPPLVSGKFDLALVGLDANQSQSGSGSRLRFQAILLGSQKAELRIESTDSHLSLIKTADGISKINGYWEIKDGPVRTRFEIDAVVTRDDSSLTIYTLDGTLAFMLGGVYQKLGSFSVPLCSVIDNAFFLNDPSISCIKP